MNCPLLQASYNTNAGNLNGDEGECLKEKCALYIDGDDICAMPAIAANLNQVAVELTNIIKVMPKEYQFRERG